MKRVKDLKELQAEFGKVNSGCAGDTIFLAKAAMFAAENRTSLAKIQAELTAIVGVMATTVARMQQFSAKKPKRQPTAYQRFFGEAIKAGKTAAQAAAEWKAALGDRAAKGP